MSSGCSLLACPSLCLCLASLVFPAERPSRGAGEGYTQLPHNTPKGRSPREGLWLARHGPISILNHSCAQGHEENDWLDLGISAPRGNEHPIDIT